MAYGGLNNKWTAAAEIERNPASKHQIQPEYMENEQADAGRDGGNLSREAKYSQARTGTGRIGNLTWLIHSTLLYVMTIHTYIHTYIYTIPPVCDTISQQQQQQEHNSFIV